MTVALKYIEINDLKTWKIGTLVTRYKYLYNLYHRCEDENLKYYLDEVSLEIKNIVNLVFSKNYDFKWEFLHRLRDEIYPKIKKAVKDENYKEADRLQKSINSLEERLLENVPDFKLKIQKAADRI